MLEIRFYGSPGEYYRIQRANPEIKDADKIFPGQVFIIPNQSDKQSLAEVSIPSTVPAESPSEINCIINDKEFKFFTSFSITEQVDSVSTFELSGPFDPDNQDHRDAFRPFSYNDIIRYAIISIF